MEKTGYLRRGGEVGRRLLGMCAVAIATLFAHVDFVAELVLGRSYSQTYCRTAIELRERFPTTTEL